MLGAIGYFLYPDDLAFLTRLIGIAFLVLSLDLVTGYCGVATLGHAAQFGVGAYAAGIACVRGITDPIALLAIGVFAGNGHGADLRCADHAVSRAPTTGAVDCRGAYWSPHLPTSCRG